MVKFGAVVGTVSIVIKVLPPVPGGVGTAFTATDTAVRLCGCIQGLIVSALVLGFLVLVLVGLLVGIHFSPGSLDSSLVQNTLS